MSAWVRKLSRIVRLTLFLDTAALTAFLDIASPSRANALLFLRASTTNCESLERQDVLNTLLKSASLFSLCFRWKRLKRTSASGTLALRDFRICRPALVRMRTRKPWRRFRLILLGWYVRFIIDLCSFRKPRAFYFFELRVVNAQIDGVRVKSLRLCRRQDRW